MQTSSYVTNSDIILGTLSLLFHLLDVLFDVRMLHFYLTHGFLFYGMLTGLFILVPNILVGFFEFLWWINFRERLEEAEGSQDNLPKPQKLPQKIWKGVFFIFKGILQIRQIQLSCRYLCLLYKVKKYGKVDEYVVDGRKNLYKLLLKLCVFAIIEGGLEALPQLLIQGYIVGSNYGKADGPFGGEVPWWVTTSILFSAFSCSFAICRAHTAIYSGTPIFDEPIVTLSSKVLLVLSNFLQLVARMITLIALFSVATLPQGIVLVFCHILLFWLLSLFENFQANEKCPSFTFMLGAVTRAFVMVFIYFLLTEPNIPIKYYGKCAVLYFEIVAVSFYWGLFKSEGHMLDMTVIILPIVMYSVGVTLTTIHFQEFRSKETAKFNENLEDVGNTERRKIYHQLGKIIGLKFEDDERFKKVA